MEDLTGRKDPFTQLLEGSYSKDHKKKENPEFFTHSLKDLPSMNDYLKSVFINSQHSKHLSSHLRIFQKPGTIKRNMMKILKRARVLFQADTKLFPNVDKKIRAKWVESVLTDDKCPAPDPDYPISGRDHTEACWTQYQNTVYSTICRIFWELAPIKTRTKLEEMLVKSYPNKVTCGEKKHWKLLMDCADELPTLYSDLESKRLMKRLQFKNFMLEEEVQKVLNQNHSTTVLQKRKFGRYLVRRLLTCFVISADEGRVLKYSFGTSDSSTESQETDPEIEQLSLDRFTLAPEQIEIIENELGRISEATKIQLRENLKASHLKSEITKFTFLFSNFGPIELLSSFSENGIVENGSISPHQLQNLLDNNGDDSGPTLEMIGAAVIGKANYYNNRLNRRDLNVNSQGSSNPKGSHSRNSRNSRRPVPVNLSAPAKRQNIDSNNRSENKSTPKKARRQGPSCDFCRRSKVQKTRDRAHTHTIENCGFAKECKMCGIKHHYAQPCPTNK